MSLRFAACRNSSAPRWRNGSRARRRGMSILVVLTIIMLAMAASYATLRSQSTMVAIAENGQSRSNARQTAQAAMSLALRKMHLRIGVDKDAWEGADTEIEGEFSPIDRYTIEYHTGVTDVFGNATDANGNRFLPNPNDPASIAEWPFCVTVVATGYGSSGQNGANETSHRVRCVVRLSNPILPTLPATHAKWNDLVHSPHNYSVIQWANSSVEMHLPARIEGAAYTQGGWNFTPNYPVDYEVRPFAGRMDEVTIYNSALSIEQIQAINTLIYNSQDYGNYGSIPFLTRLLLGVSGVSSLPAPIARWKLDDANGTTVATDSAGSNHGVYYGAKPGSFTTPSSTNRGATFDGYNDIINLGKFDLSGNKLTILAWFRADHFDLADSRIISKSTTASSQDQWWAISTTPSGGGTKLRFRLKAGGSMQELTATSGNLAANTWTFVAATYDGSNMRLYKDGALVGTVAKTGNINSNASVWVFLGGNPPGSTRARYLRDLRAMEQAGAGNGVPLPNTLHLPRSRTTSAETLSLLEEDLQTTIVNATAENYTSFVPHPNVADEYRLYPGGKTYHRRKLTGASLSDTNLQPDLDTNPLGIFTRDGILTLYDSNTIKGTIILKGSGSSGDLEVSGKNNSLQPVNIPRLDGSGAMLQLPIVIAEDDFKVLGSGGVSATGAIVAGDDFQAVEGNDSVSFVVQGKVIAKEFYISRRWQWDGKGGAWWRDRLTAFLAQMDPNGTNDKRYFPQWLKNTQALDPVPKIKFGPDPTNPTYHWHPFGNQTLYSYDANSATGLHWDIITWDERRTPE